MKRYMYLIIFTVLFLTCNYKVKAECSDAELNRLRAQAAQVKITYEYRSDLSQDGDVFDLIVTGLTDEIYIHENKSGSLVIGMSYVSDGIGRVKAYFATSGTYAFLVYSYNPSCMDKLRTVTVTVPKYNKYADREECNGIDTTKFILCDKWYQGNITEDYFQARLAKYKKGNPTIEDPVDVEDKIDEKTFLDTIKDYYVYIIAGTILVIGLATYMIITKRKKGALD